MSAPEKYLQNLPLHRLYPTTHGKIVWGCLALLVVADVIGLSIAGITLAHGTLTLAAVTVFFLLLLSAVYTVIRPDARIAALGHLAAVVLIFSAGAEILSYAAVSQGGPLVDAPLAAFDHMLGFDWRAVYDAIAAHRWLHIGLILAYWCPPGQMIFLLVVLCFLGRIDRCWEMQWLFMIIVTAAIILSTLFPAAGAFDFYQVQAHEPYVDAFHALRAGTFKIINKENLEGVIQFPSLHIAWAIIYTYAARRVKYLFPALLVINILVAIATPAIGGHHLTDIIAGAALTLAAIALVRHLTARGFLPKPVAQ